MLRTDGFFDDEIFQGADVFEFEPAISKSDFLLFLNQFVMILIVLRVETARGRDERLASR